MACKFKFLETQGAEWIEETLSSLVSDGSADRRQLRDFKNKEKKKSSEYAKKFDLKKEVEACRAVSSSLNLVYLGMRILSLRPEFGGSVRKLVVFPQAFTLPGGDWPSRSRWRRLVSGCRLSGAPGQVCGSPPDGLPPQLDAGAAAHAEDAGGRGQTAAEPTPAPPWVQPQRMTVGGKPQEEPLVVVDGQTGLSITWLIIAHYIETVIIDQITHGIRAYVDFKNKYNLKKIYIFHLKHSFYWNWILNRQRMISFTRLHFWENLLFNVKVRN